MGPGTPRAPLRDSPHCGPGYAALALGGPPVTTGKEFYYWDEDTLEYTHHSNQLGGREGRGPFWEKDINGCS